MKSLFLDLGTNLGQGLREFNKRFNLFNNSSWDIYTFEANLHIDIETMFNDVENLTKIKKAVWIEDGKISFTSRGKNTEKMRKEHNEDKFQGGGSRLTIKQGVQKIADHVEIDENEVECFSFSDFIDNKKDSYERIVVKMDIEGAEFEIIEDMKNKDTLKYIDELFMEPHGRFMFREPKKIKDIENKLFKDCREKIRKVHVWH